MPRAGVKSSRFRPCLEVQADPKREVKGRAKRGGLSVTELRKRRAPRAARAARDTCLGARLKALGLKVAGSKAELEARYEADLRRKRVWKCRRRFRQGGLVIQVRPQ